MTDNSVILAELQAGTKAMREYVDSTPYGRLISDDICQNVAAVVVSAADQARAAATKTAAENLLPVDPPPQS